MFGGLFAGPLDSEATSTATGGAPRIIASYDLTAVTQAKCTGLGGLPTRSQPNDPLNTPICSLEDLATFGDRGALSHGSDAG